MRVLPLAGVSTTAHAGAGALRAVSGLPLDVHPDELRRRFHATEHMTTPRWYRGLIRTFAAINGLS